MRIATISLLLLGAASFIHMSDAGAASVIVYESIDTNGTPHFSSERLSPADRVTQYGENFTSRSSSSIRWHQADAEIRDIIVSACHRYSVPAALALAVASVESNFNRSALSTKGAIGIMQIMPDSLRRNTDIALPAENIDRGVKRLGELIHVYRGNLALVAAAYNAGDSAVARYGYRIPPFPETMLYVSSVLNRMNDFSEPPP